MLFALAAPDFKPLAKSPCSTTANLGQSTAASARQLTQRFKSLPAAAAEVFPGARLRRAPGC